MTTATLQLRESQQQSQGLQVDRENGVIRNVKILGWQSRNVGRTIGLDRREFGEALDQTYTYAEAFARTAAPLYEGKTVNVDHWTKEGDRPVSTVFGELRGVYVAEDGIYAKELLYAKKHDRTEHILELAERFPHKIGLSHVAAGEPVLHEGKVVIQSWEPECVDLVSTPATTQGLYESTRTRKRKAKVTTLRKFIESTKDADLKAILIEMETDEMIAGDMPLDVAPVEAVEADPEAQLKTAILQMVTAKLADATPEQLKKLLKVLAVEDSLTSILGGSSEAPAADAPAEVTEGDDAAEDDDEDEDEDKEAGDKAMESLKQENKTLKARAALLESGRKATDVRVSALVAVSDELQAELIESWAADLAPVDKAPAKERGTKPVTSPPANGSTGDAMTWLTNRVKKLQTGAN